MAEPSASSYTYELDCGVTEYKHMPHNPQLATDPSYVADEYVGSSLDEAQARAEAEGWEVRVLGVDGDCDGRTDERRQNRVTHYVEDAVVKAAARY